MLDISLFLPKRPRVMGRYLGAIGILIILFSGAAQGQYKRLTRQEYIATYKDKAIREMERTGIPASIKLAQGILESGDGNSTLARKANNHFGIKCHSDWKGKKVYHDDDARNECFRKYRNPDESFVDHSEFLVHRSRYRFLFDLDPDDYKGWARGLKKAGYATSPTYARRLIEIIEDNKLYIYDNPSLLVKHPWESEQKRVDRQTERQILENNRIKYIIAKSGDTYKTLAEELGKFPKELAKYNEQKVTATIKSGETVYLQPKRNKAAHGNDYHVVEKGETMYAISQKYGIKLEKLYKKNEMEKGAEPKVGQQLWLRKNKGGGGLFDFLKSDKNEEEKKDEAPGFEIEFEG
jgi:LysM repeat protein